MAGRRSVWPWSGHTAEWTGKWGFLWNYPKVRNHSASGIPRPKRITEDYITPRGFPHDWQERNENLVLNSLEVALFFRSKNWFVQKSLTLLPN